MDRPITHQSLEWLFPLRGRWLKYLLRAVELLAVIWVLLLGLWLSEKLPRLASGRDLRLGWSSSWKTGEQHGPFSLRAPTDFVLHVGPVTAEYEYPPSGKRNRSEGPIGLGMFLLLPVGWLGWGWLRLPRDVLPRFAGWSVFLGSLLMFTSGVACGPLGCRSINAATTLAGMLFGY